MTTVAVLICSADLACSPGRATIFDGDTVSVEPFGMKVRALGYDTPEIHRCSGRRATGCAKCPEELRLAAEATARLARLLEEGGRIELSGRRDRYGRELARLVGAEGEIGGVLVGEGPARWWPDGARTWC